MKILLDENFPLALVPRLREAGYEVEHVILLGLRGQPDSAIIKRLESEARLLLTQDQEFLERSVPTHSAVIVSRVTQSLAITFRLDIWSKSILEYFSRDWDERVFEVFDDGKLIPRQPVRGED